MDRTAGMPGWLVVKPFVSQSSNCILPAYVINAIDEEQLNGLEELSILPATIAYVAHLDPGTQEPYRASPTWPRQYRA